MPTRKQESSNHHSLFYYNQFQLLRNVSNLTQFLIGYALKAANQMLTLQTGLWLSLWTFELCNERPKFGTKFATFQCEFNDCLLYWSLTRCLGAVVTCELAKQCFARYLTTRLRARDFYEVTVDTMRAKPESTITS